MSRPLLLLLAALLAAPAAQAQLAQYDFAATDCGDAGALARTGFEARDAERDGGGPSVGADTGPVGMVDLSVGVVDTAEVRPVRLYVPSGYDPSRPWPLVLALHGAAGSSGAAPAAADAIRTLWMPLAEREGVIVLAPVAGGSQGGWLPERDTPLLACALAQVSRRWAVDLDRRYLWGFSAGGHYGHAIALANAGRFAAYAVNAGVLQALACSPGDCPVVLAQPWRPLPASLRVGTTDSARRPYVQADFQRFQDAGWAVPAQVQYQEFVGGHVYAPSDTEAAWAWFAAHPRPR